MNSMELMRREVLRLTGATRRSAFINTHRLSAFYNISEKNVRLELAKLADEKVIRLAGWQSREQFLANVQEGSNIKVDLVE